MSATSFVLAVLFSMAIAVSTTALLSRVFRPYRLSWALSALTALAAVVIAFFVLFALAFFLVESGPVIWLCGALIGLAEGAILSGGKTVIRRMANRPPATDTTRPRREAE
ncbi:hypothetical protein GRI58_15055 [Porphyrobacter algicida]|uniref:Uncharacterized protein n=1 Tax=Qipengyuania algicida TaxID=1836209 RepID=A0A845ANP9_9SPHN|nr:hypothetical protein [Qipengyuania algicida]MXP30126.1 hypothetical protein [Qipengyuania algicida]